MAIEKKYLKNILLKKGLLLRYVFSFIFIWAVFIFTMYSWLRFSEKTTFIKNAVGKYVYVLGDDGQFHKGLLSNAEVRYNYDAIKSGFFELRFNVNYIQGRNVCKNLAPWELWRIEVAQRENEGGSYNVLSSDIP